MTQHPPSTPQLKSVPYRMFIILVTLIALVLAGLYSLAPLPDHAREVLYILNYVDALILLIDFFVRLVQAPRKLRYLLPLGLLDLVGSLPGFPFLRLLRVPSLVIELWKLRKAGSHDLLAVVRSRLAESTLLTGILVVFLMLAVGGSAMVWIESPAEGSNIKTGKDALWYAIVTIATVGYGDLYPVTQSGRMIGSAMIVVGVGIFSVLTGYLSTLFLSRAKQVEHQKELDPQRQEAPALMDGQQTDVTAEISALRAEIAKLREELAKRT